MESQQALMSTATHTNHNEIIPVHSQMLWFRNVGKRSQKVVNDVPKIVVSATEIPNKYETTQALLSKRSVSVLIIFSIL